MYNVLICDDDVAATNLLIKNMNWSEFGMKVIGTAPNGAAGLELFRNNKVDVAFVDIKMPIMNGMDMATMIRRSDKRVKIVFLTSSDDVNHAIRAINIRADGYILKPFSMEEIRQVLRNVKTLLDDSEVKQEPEEAKGANEEVGIVAAVNAYITAHVNEKIKISDIAESLGYSTTYLGQCYKTQTGIFINEKITEKKMKLALELLDVPINQIGAIADKLGYSDYTYFIKQFKEYYGITPKAYRSTRKNDI